MINHSLDNTDSIITWHRHLKLRINLFVRTKYNQTRFYYVPKFYASILVESTASLSIGRKIDLANFLRIRLAGIIAYRFVRLSTSKVRGLSGQILTHSRSQSRGQLQKVDAKAAWRVRQIGGSSSTFSYSRFAT